MDVCKDYVQQDDFEATVITLAMIREAVEGQNEGKQSGHLSTLPSTLRDDQRAPKETELDSVEQIILACKGIYRVDNLWVLPNLTDLNLSCNNIQFIENLNCLPNLIKLNLSCNKIEKIEHIDQLFHLEIFNIHNNQISILNNFENSKMLKIFNVRNNALLDLQKNVLFLRRFKNLRSLCILGNPCCNKLEYVDRFIIAYLPQLVYLEYKFVTKNTRDKHKEYYAADLEILNKEEEKISEENNREETDEKHLNDQKLAFVENLNNSQLFELMQDRDPHSHIMVMMKGDMPSIYERYQQEFCVYTQQLFRMGKEEHQKRVENMNEFLDTFETLKTQVIEKNRNLVEDFIARKAFIFYEISQIIQEIEQSEEVEDTKNITIEKDNFQEKIKGNDLEILKTQIGKTMNQKEPEVKSNSNTDLTEKQALQDKVENNAHSSFETNVSKFDPNDKILALNDKFHDTCNKTYDEMMKNEDTLHEQLVDLISTLDRVYLENDVDNFTRQAQLLFTHLRDIEKTYMAIIKEHSRKYFNKNIGNASVPAQLRQILVSEDKLSNVLDISDQAQLDTIDDREETMLTNIAQWHKELIENMRDEETERHRRCVNEICHLIDINREELDDVVSDVALVDPDLLI